MKGSSKVVMGATMAIVVILAIVLGLVLVLLAELYCSLLFRRRKLNKSSKPTSMAEIQIPQIISQQNQTSPLSTFYSQGVLEAPRSFLFPKQNDDVENQQQQQQQQRTHRKLHQFLTIQSPHQISQSKIHQLQVEEEEETDVRNGELMYISNPIYDNNDVAIALPNRVDTTPFETPDTSPTGLGRVGSSGDDVEEGENGVCSLPLSPMKEILEKGSCSSKGNSSHDVGRSSSSSCTPCTSPSW